MSSSPPKKSPPSADARSGIAGVRVRSLAKKIRALPGLDPRTRTTHGHRPELLYSFCPGRVSLADTERWTFAGRAEVFFDDTQTEVFGPSFEEAVISGARIAP